MITWGISAQGHDAAIAVFQNNDLVFAGHAERYSRIKNDPQLNQDIIDEALQFGEPNRVVWYENTSLKWFRRLVTRSFYKKEIPTPQYIKKFYDGDPLIVEVGHHHSHAAAGYYTSPFTDATVIVIDAIGEWDTFTIWTGKGRKLKKRFSKWYPNSLGLWYSAMTQRCDLIPNEHEYILMGMAALGNPDKLYATIKNDFFKATGANFKSRYNLHRGCRWWNSEGHWSHVQKHYYDIAAATQKIYEEFLDEICIYALKKYPSKNVVLMGGCALNCVANSKITHYWDNVWIMPNPGDAGSSVGAVLADKRDFVNWPGAMLGHNIPGKYPVEVLANHLGTTRIVGVANGRAEFGPRALGNRSLLADPRGEDIKDLVNQYKKREPFRPFAPAILEEYVHDYFDIPVDKSPYMQFVGKCKYPDKFPAIIHYDGTSRVQTVSKEDNPGFRKLLERWYELTGCPMVLNTSLNVRGEPLVNTKEDAQRWTMENNLPVVCLEE